MLDLVGRGRVTAAKFRPGGWTAFTGLPPAPDTVVPAPGRHDAVAALDAGADDLAALGAALGWFDPRTSVAIPGCGRRHSVGVSGRCPRNRDGALSDWHSHG